MKNTLATLFLGLGISFSANAGEVRVGDYMWSLTDKLERGELIPERGYISNGRQFYINLVKDKNGRNLWQTVLQECVGRKIMIGFYDFSTRTYYLDLKSPLGNFPNRKIDEILKNVSEKNFKASSCPTKKIIG